MPGWARLVVAVATVRVALALVLYLAAPGRPLPSEMPPLFVYAALSTTLTAVGIGLLLANRQDVRAAWLGGVFTLLGTPLAQPLAAEHSTGATGFLFLYVHPEAFVSAFLWRFLELFPSDLPPAAAKRARVVSTVIAAAAAWCTIALLLSGWAGISELPSFARQLILGTTQSFWLITVSISGPVLVVLLWRAYAAPPADRWRVRLFIGGLLIGLGPFTLELLIEEAWPAYKAFVYTPAVRPWVGAVIFGLLAFVPLLTTYSVLFDRIVDVRVVLQTAAQYALARYTILASTLVPFAALAVFLVNHRQESLATVFAQGPRPAALTACVVLGVAALRLRTGWLDAIDRRYFREPYDARQMLMRIMNQLGTSRPGELGAKIAKEIDSAMHADVDVFLANERLGSLCHVEEELPPISLNATLATMAVADERPMDVDLDNPSSPLHRLPLDERRWLERGRFTLLVGFRRADGGTAGILALTPKKSGLPYSVEDRHLLSAVASAAGLALDRLRLRSATDSAGDSPAARECRTCFLLNPGDAATCSCGGKLVTTSVPYLLRGVFQFERRIGAGAMGVVYRAIDVNLERPVAIKALPHITPERVARIRREARAMALVTHPNLAVIYGVETWQDVPFLVQEYVGGGTLAEKIASSRSGLFEVLDMGVTLAECVRDLHKHRIVHCDIKPSNIGFTSNGIVKVLDFGLARVLHTVAAPSHAPTLTESSSGTSPFEAHLTVGPFGSPPYMSPEAIEGRPPDPARDLWALAVVLFEAIVGRRPFEGTQLVPLRVRILSEEPPPDVRSLRQDVPASVASFFDAALARDPVRRFPDADAFTAELRRLRDQCR